MPSEAKATLAGMATSGLHSVITHGVRVGRLELGEVAGVLRCAALGALVVPGDRTAGAGIGRRRGGCGRADRGGDEGGSGDRDRRLAPMACHSGLPLFFVGRERSPAAVQRPWWSAVRTTAVGWWRDLSGIRTFRFNSGARSERSGPTGRRRGAASGGRQSGRLPVGNIASMGDYAAPLDDMRFVLEHVTDLAGLARLDGFEHADPETVAGLLDEAGRFFAEQFAPLNRVGDVQHSRRNDDGSGHHARRLRQGLPALRRGRLAGGAVPAGVRRRRLPVARRHRRCRSCMTSANMAFSLCPLLTQGAIDMLAALRQRGAARDVPAEDGDRRVDRHDEPHRAAGRLRRRRAHHPGRARRRRHVADHRPEDLHHLRRARPRRQHRPPRAGPGARRARRAPRASRASSCPSSSSRDDGTLGERNAVAVRVDRAQDGHQRQPDVRARLRRRRRLPHRRAQPGHALHVHDDEHGPPVGRRRGPGASAERAYQQAVGVRPRAACRAGPSAPRRGADDRRAPRRAPDAAHDAGPHRGAALPRLPQRRVHRPRHGAPRRGGARGARPSWPTCSRRSPRRGAPTSASS